MPNNPAKQRALRVLVTRPEPQNTQLCQHLSAQGWQPVSLPLLSFEAQTPSPPDALPKPDVIIVVSPRAVQFGLTWLRKNHATLFANGAAADASAHSAPEAKENKRGRPSTNITLNNTLWVAIGPSTQAALEEAGIRVHNTPEKDQTSERLLETSLFKSLPAGRTIWIIKGAGGRKVIQSTLSDQGHTVICLDVYKRTLPSYTVLQLEIMRESPIDCFTVTSSEILNALFRLLNPDPNALDNPTTAQATHSISDSKKNRRSQPLTHMKTAWQETTLLVVGQRQANDAKQLGFKHVVISPGADNHTLVQTLNQWRDITLDHAP